MTENQVIFFYVYYKVPNERGEGGNQGVHFSCVCIAQRISGIYIYIYIYIYIDIYVFE